MPLRERLEEHTKRSHSGEHEEVTMFFPVNPVTGQPRGQEVKSSKSALGASHAHLAVFLDGPSAGGGRSSGGGRASTGRVASGTLHATLPTKVKLTGMPMHLNSGFLLSVDRQNVEVNQNAWNRALLGQLPRLLRLLLTWVASTEATQSDATAAATTSSLSAQQSHRCCMRVDAAAAALCSRECWFLDGPEEAAGLFWVPWASLDVDAGRGVEPERHR